VSEPVLSSFRPARSFGWAWLVGPLLFILVSLLPALTQPGMLSGEEAVGAWLAIGITVPLVVLVLVVLVALPLMRYDLEREALVVSCGPILRYRIPYAAITDVRRTDLTPSLWSSMRFPGLAMWTVQYADIGTVRMCATRMAKGILLIEADGRRYGITPADEKPFADALMMMLPNPGRPDAAGTPGHGGPRTPDLAGDR